MTKLLISAITDKGKIRSNNEDNFSLDGLYLPENTKNMKKPLQLQKGMAEKVLLAIFDGIGGNSYGEKASYVAAKAMEEQYSLIEGSKVENEAFYVQTCRKMNQEVCKLQKEYCSNMGTTVSSLFWNNGTLTVCNAGDSPIFMLKEGKLIRIYEEHTNRKLYEKLMIDRKPELTQNIGINEEEMIICPYIHTIELEGINSFLISSDGLTDMVTDKRIEEILLMDSAQEEKISLLLNEALQNGGRDNITIILMQFL